MMKYEDDLALAKLEAPANRKLVNRMLKIKPKKLDTIFEEEHDAVFEQVDCMQCANCCKTTSPIFRDADVKRLAKSLKMSAANFEIQYLRRDEDDDLVLKMAPCPFLEEDNSCGVYDNRPLACKEYPHTDRKRIGKILDLTLANTHVCPAVARIFESLKLKL